MLQHQSETIHVAVVAYSKSMQIYYTTWALLSLPFFGRKLKGQV